MSTRGRPAPFYADGVRFACTGCARCCYNRGEYEAVWLTVGEIRAIAEYRGVTVPALRAESLERLDGSWSLGSRGDACVFLRAGRCAIYPVRPRQCRTWPFWSENLTRSVWEREVEGFCPGVGQGRLYSAREIRAIARATDDPRIPLPSLPVAADGED